MNKEHVMLVDGMALLFRSFYATALNNYFMINSKGLPTNALFGFTKHLFAAKNEIQPTHIICCWDLAGATYRNEIFSDYKANRTEAPVELIPQFDLARELVSSLNIPNIDCEGFEADDCIGTIVKDINSEAKATIVTGDKDLLQLVNENTSVAILNKGIGNYEIFNEEVFIKKYGIRPNQFSDVKALMGDPSDNYAGVRGIGEKTAIKLIKDYESIEGILDNLDQLTQGQRTKIENDLEHLRTSQKLAKIYQEVPLSYSLEESICNVDKDKALKMFQYLEFKGLNKLLMDQNSSNLTLQK